MEKIIRVGVDLAKNVMQIHAVDSTEHVLVRKAVRREHFLNWFANLQPCRPSHSPADASLTSSRTPAHGSGATWLAMPSS